MWKVQGVERLLEHGMKVWERVLNERLKQVTNVGEKISSGLGWENRPLGPSS